MESLTTFPYVTGRDREPDRPMQRLALAILMVAAVIGLVVFLASAFRRPAGGAPQDEGATPMQRVAYFVLIALMLYVSIVGSTA